jgi:hypothetical protein
MDFTPNAITTSLLTGGDLWWDGNKGVHNIALPGAGPDAEPLTTIFAGGLWLSATTVSGRETFRVQQYGRSGNRFDFAAGPLSAEGIVSPDCNAWDRFFPISSNEVEAAFLLRSFGLPINPNALPEAVLGWPGTGNPHFESVNGMPLPDEPQGYAPFTDEDEDGIYDPTKGDLPLFAGDEAVWLLFSTASVAQQSGVGSPFPLEIHLMAYGFRSDEATINQTIYYDYKFISRSGEDLIDFRAGQFIDSDMGCFTNDAAESMPEANLFYVFNRSVTEPEPCDAGVRTTEDQSPVNIFKVLSASSSGPGDDNPRLMERFYLRRSIEPTPGTQVTYSHQGWSDGTPLTRGGTGYNPGLDRDTTNYMFDGGDVGNTPWRICNTDSLANGSTTYNTFFPTTLSPGDTYSFSFSVSPVFNIPFEDSCPDRATILARGNTVQDHYDDNRPMVTTATRAPGDAAGVAVVVFPNPASEEITFRLPSNQQAATLTLFDLTGRRLTTVRPQANTFTLSVGELALPAGTYFYRLVTEADVVVTGKVIIRP